ncbi:MAG: SEC-C domain-containing protein [Burkholderiales bacterium]|nr:SEC-C domain-containing protein [Burkholderiales bacterium]
MLEQFAALQQRTARQQVAMPVPTRRPGRNDACPCGSGRKYKHCHGAGAPGA